MEHNRSTERQHLGEDCSTCRDFAREDGRLMAFEDIYKQLNILFDEKLGNYDSNDLKIKKHGQWLFALTLSTIILFAMFGFILIFK